MRFIQYNVVRGYSAPNHYGTDTDGSETQDIVTDLRNHFHSSGRKPLAWRIPAEAGIRAPGSRRDLRGESPLPGDARSR
jgi:hypothetical protein